MNRLFLFILLFFTLSFASTGQTIYVPVTYISDTLPRVLDTNWLFTDQDDSAFASPSYDDSKWKVINDPQVQTNVTKKKYYVFEGKGWFRLHLYVDSNVVNKVLSLHVKHYGASEIYVDGIRVGKYGIIKDKEHTEYESPLGVPIPVNLHPGNHVIAVRYANYNALTNYTYFNEDGGGFLMHIDNARVSVYANFIDNLVSSSLSVFIFTFFFAFFLLHLFLFIYNKKEKANLYFSIFCLSFGVIFMVPYMRINIPNPIFQLSAYHILMVAIASMCMSLSGFLNELFGSKKLRFTIIALLSLLSVVVWFF